VLGDKSVAVFSGGKIDLHGKKVISWDRLALKANIGDSQITLFNPVDWEVGDIIVIATTGRYPLLFPLSSL
jgi:hypothetical protein